MRKTRVESPIDRNIKPQVSAPSGRSSSAGSVEVARSARQLTGSGAIPTPALQSPLQFKPKELVVKPISPGVARGLCERHHYLKSYPGGTLFNLGVFAGQALVGVVVIGVGPFNAHRFFRNAKASQVACLSRFWMDDRCAKNTESRVLGFVLRSLRRWRPDIKALVAYSDPSVGHLGVIYKAAGFAFLGHSDPTPLYRLPDGSLHHPRTLGHRFGTRSLAHFKESGFEVQAVPQVPKNIYVFFLDPSWRDRLTRSISPYPTSEVFDESL